MGSGAKDGNGIGLLGILLVLSGGDLDGEVVWRRSHSTMQEDRGGVVILEVHFEA